MKNYYRLMLGKNSIHADACIAGNFVGTDFDVTIDLTNHLPENWRDFNAKFRDDYQAAHPGMSKIAAGLSCGFLWTVSKGFKIGDIVIAPTGSGSYRVGEITSNYYFEPNGILPHRRNIKWLDVKFDRTEMSEPLRNSTRSIGTVCAINQYGTEIEAFISGSNKSPIFSSDATIEDPAAFALEKHLEDFLVQNWRQTELGRDFDIFEEDGELVGQQYQSDTGPMDILAIKKDKSQLLVVELKKGRASDAVVGQILRYMGYVKQELAEANQTVKGVIIALEDDVRIKRALAMTPDISFYRYEVSFKLTKAN